MNFYLDLSLTMVMLALILYCLYLFNKQAMILLRPFSPEITKWAIDKLSHYQEDIQSTLKDRHDKVGSVTLIRTDPTFRKQNKIYSLLNNIAFYMLINAVDKNVFLPKCRWIFQDGIDAFYQHITPYTKPQYSSHLKPVRGSRLNKHRYVKGANNSLYRDVLLDMCIKGDVFIYFEMVSLYYASPTSEHWILLSGVAREASYK